jgi:hypothetical protein
MASDNLEAAKAATNNRLSRPCNTEGQASELLLQETKHASPCHDCLDTGVWTARDTERVRARGEIQSLAETQREKRYRKSQSVRVRTRQMRMCARAYFGVYCHSSATKRGFNVSTALSLFSPFPSLSESLSLARARSLSSSFLSARALALSTSSYLPPSSLLTSHHLFVPSLTSGLFLLPHFGTHCLSLIIPTPSTSPPLAFAFSAIL